MKEDELEKKAVEELLKEAKRGKDRAETMGPSGWLKCPLASTNKRFLMNTIKSTLPAEREKRDSSEKDEKERRDGSREREYSKRHRAHPYKKRDDSRKEKKRSPSSSKRQSQSKKDHKRR